MWYSEWFRERCEWWYIYTHWDRLQHQYGKIPSMGSQPILISQTVAKNSQFFTSAQWKRSGNRRYIWSRTQIRWTSWHINPGTVQTSSFNTQRLTHVWMTVLFEYVSIWSESVLPATVPAAEKAVSSAVSPPWAESRGSSDLTEPSPARSPSCSSYKTQTQVWIKGPFTLSVCTNAASTLTLQIN